MRFVKYLKNSAGEYLLCLLMAACLSFNVLQGFYLPADLQTNFLAVMLFAAACCLVLYCCGYNKKTIIFSIIGFVLLAVLMVLRLQASDILSLQGQELEEALPYFYLVTFGCSLVVYLLSRRKAGCIFLAAFGAVVICAVIFMEFEGFWWAYLIYIFAAVCMCYYRNYRVNAVKCSTVKPAFAIFSAITAIVSAAVLLLSVGISVLFIQPLNLAVRDFKPFVRYLSFEVLEISAISTNIVLPDPNKKSYNTNDNVKTTHKESEENDTVEYIEVMPTLDNLNTYTINYSNRNNFLYAIRYTLAGIPPILWILLLPVLIAAIFGGKLLSRRLWFKKLQKLSREEQVRRLYLFFLSRFAKMNYKREVFDTPIEYANRVGDKLRDFNTEGASLHGISEIFVRVGYGELSVSDEDYRKYLSFYGNFYKAAKDKMGFWKYTRKFFVL